LKIVCSPPHAPAPVRPGARLAPTTLPPVGARAGGLAAAALLLALLGLLASPARAAEFRRLLGEVVDADTGAPLSGVTVTLLGPDGAADGLDETRVTGGEGAFDFGDVPVGDYRLDFARDDYRPSSMTDFPVLGGELNRADFPLTSVAAASASGDDDGAADVEEFVVTAEKVEDLMTLRLDSDALLNVVGAEEFSKFSAGDVAEVLERVAGVTVAEGQFAIIRGLEDRYSSTVLNGAAVPSPDPTSQSVQLDLFPSEVVGNLGVQKSFSPELPSNSSGGNIDIKTHAYPDEFQMSLKAGYGYNENAHDRFLKHQGTTDVDTLVNGLQSVGTDADGFPVYETREELQSRGVRLVGANPVGTENDKDGNFFKDLRGVMDTDYVGTIGGKRIFGDREFRFKGVLSRETDFETAEGFQEKRVPRPETTGEPSLGDPIFIPTPPFVIVPIIPGELIVPADLPQGLLGRSRGNYDLTISERQQQSTAFAGFGFDLDDDGDHQIDSSFLWTRVKVDTVRQQANLFLPGFDYEGNAQAQVNEQQFIDNAFVDFTDDVFGLFRLDSNNLSDGSLIFSQFEQSISFETDRDLWVAAVNGDHDFSEVLPGFHLSWAWNTAETTQTESAVGLSYFYEPCGFSAFIPCPDGVDRIDVDTGLPASFPTNPGTLGPGSFAFRNSLLLSANDILETSNFWRIDADYEIHLSERSSFTIAGGVWMEEASRDVKSAFLESPTVTEGSEICDAGSPSAFACKGDTELEIGETAFDAITLQNGNLGGIRTTTNESSREISAWHLRGKLSIWERIDFLGGIRREIIRISSRNDPFILNAVTGEFQDFLGGPQTYPSRFILFDRLDNPFLNEVGEPPPDDFVFNDQILGINSQPGPCVGDDGSLGDVQCVDLIDPNRLRDLFNGEIDERRLFPSAGITIRPFEGMILRGAWSKTVARPSFRELGYYVTVDPGTNDLIVGNPTLQLSDVESWDARLEYTWGFRGDLFAVSWFKKTIDNPIEAIILRDPINQEFLSTSGLFQTFFNNPNTADLWGVELEARKSLGFLELLEDHAGIPMPDWLEYLSIGGNWTYIDAEVARTEIEIQRAQPFFEGGPPGAQFQALAPTRRLFNQPEWIANADVTFDHPDWGLSATLAYFAISDVLDAAGSAAISNTGETLEYVPDRYIGSFQDLRATIAKTFQLPSGLGELTFRATAKNLLDSPRELIYDPAQTAKEITEQELQTGIDYGFSITFRRYF